MGLVDGRWSQDYCGSNRTSCSFLSRRCFPMLIDESGLIWIGSRSKHFSNYFNPSGASHLASPRRADIPTTVCTEKRSQSLAHTKQRFIDIYFHLSEPTFSWSPSPERRCFISILNEMFLDWSLQSSALAVAVCLHPGPPERGEKRRDRPGWRSLKLLVSLLPRAWQGAPC